MYYPLSNSQYISDSNSDILELVESDIVQLKPKGNILLCGDFNARVAALSDFILDDGNQWLPTHNDYTADRDILSRRSLDVTSDSRGKDVIDLCVSLLNGRALGDLRGQYTYHTPNRSSSVDYVWVSESIRTKYCFFMCPGFYLL